MEKKPIDKQEVIKSYRRRAQKYDITVRLFDIFAWFGFNISGWRKEAISKLNLKSGDTVIDIGCGTGLNFPFLYQAVGQKGKIIGVDLSVEMLAEARQRAASNQWDNVQLECVDASEFEFPKSVAAVLSTYAMTLVPDCGHVVINACESLSPNGRLVVLDMAWPRYCPLWAAHSILFAFLWRNRRCAKASSLGTRPKSNARKSCRHKSKELLVWVLLSLFWCCTRLAWTKGAAQPRVIVSR